MASSHKVTTQFHVIVPIAVSGLFLTGTKRRKWDDASATRDQTKITQLQPVGLNRSAVTSVGGAFTQTNDLKSIILPTVGLSLSRASSVERLLLRGEI